MTWRRRPTSVSPRMAGTFLGLALAACAPVGGDLPGDGREALAPQELATGVRWGACVCVRLDRHFDNDGIASPKDAPDGNFDIPGAPAGDTFPPQGMPDPGARFAPAGAGGACFLFPPHGDGAKNNVSCRSQKIDVEPGTYGTLLVLGASEADSQESTLALLGADGGRTALPFRLTDWCQAAKFAEAPVLRWSYRIDHRGARDPTPCALFVQAVALPGVALAGIELPDNPRMHVFALTLHDLVVTPDPAAVAPALEPAPEPPPAALRPLSPPPEAPADFSRPGPLMAAALVPTGSPAPQRWADVAGTEYAPGWQEKFSYAGARVDVAWVKRGGTFAGALSARGLKPNFAYQLKLVGDRADAQSFETIGRLGRWLLDPDTATRTNFTDRDYEKSKTTEGLQIEAYILFDYLVTDARGAATKSFSLDSSYHVVWGRELNKRRGPGREDSRATTHSITRAGEAYPPDTPAEAATAELWLEHEWVNRRPATGRVRLPPGVYRAAFQLTEESFHLTKNGGWARVLQAPVEFEIVD